MRQQRTYYNRTSVPGSPGGLGLPGAGNASAQPIVLTLQPPAHTQAPSASSRVGISLQGFVPHNSAGLLDILNDSDDENDSNDSTSGSSNSSGVPSPYIGCLDDVGSNSQKPYKIYTRSGTSPSRGGSFYSGRLNANPTTPRGINISITTSGANNDRTPKRMKSIDLDRSLDEDPLMRSTSVPIGVSRSGLLTPRSNEIGLNQLSLNSSSDEESDGYDSNSSCSSSSSSSYKQKIRIFANDDRDSSSYGSSAEKTSVNSSGNSYINTGNINGAGAKYFKVTQRWNPDYVQGDRENERANCDSNKFIEDQGGCLGAGQNVGGGEEDPGQGLWDEQEWAMRMRGSETDIEIQVRNFRVLENSCVGSHVKDISTCFDAKRLLSEDEILPIVRQQYEFAAMLNSASKEARVFLEITGDNLFTDNKSAAKMSGAGSLRQDSSDKAFHDEKIYLSDDFNDDDDYLSPDEQ